METQRYSLQHNIKKYYKGTISPIDTSVVHRAQTQNSIG